jgi:hypothetical protein
VAEAADGEVVADDEVPEGGDDEVPVGEDVLVGELEVSGVGYAALEAETGQGPGKGVPGSA